VNQPPLETKKKLDDSCFPVTPFQFEPESTKHRIEEEKGKKKISHSGAQREEEAKQIPSKAEMGFKFLVPLILPISRNIPRSIAVKPNLGIFTWDLKDRVILTFL